MDIYGNAALSSEKLFSDYSTGWLTATANIHAVIFEAHSPFHRGMTGLSWPLYLILVLTRVPNLMGAYLAVICFPN